jgi:hypothetical protein
MFPPRQSDKLYLRAWSWLKGKPLQGHVQFDMGCDLTQYEIKVKTIVGIHLQNLFGENSFKGFQTPSLKGHLHINVTCIRMLTSKSNESLRSWLGL